MSWADELALFRHHLAEILRGAALGRYERDLRQQTAELNDLFLLLCFMEATALPNPATLYLLEVYPYLLEQFHAWHRRMGIAQSPIGSLPVLLTDRDVVFFGGKGGTGKTTCSAAFAVRASRHGRPVLLVSTDPAHSTSDIFARPIGDTPRELLPNLSAVEINAEAESARYIAQVKRDVEQMFSAGVVRQAHRQIEMAAASPGLAEVALLDRMIDLIAEHADKSLLVFDTAPTGHTLQLLRMPDAMTTWIQALLKHRRALLDIDRGGDDPDATAPADDPVLTALERRHRRLTTLRAQLTDRRRTSFVLVTIPERLAIEETIRARDLLTETGVDVAALVVNRILPEGLSGAFYASRKAQEREYLEEIDRRFSQLARVRIAQLPRDVYGLEALDQISAQLTAPLS